jgi:hypothetical protein
MALSPLLSGYCSFRPLGGPIQQRRAASARHFSWLVNQPYGQVLVATICVGLIAFSLFSFVNAGYRVIPEVSGSDIETLAVRLASKVRHAT